MKNIIKELKHLTHKKQKKKTIKLKNKTHTKKQESL